MVAAVHSMNGNGVNGSSPLDDYLDLLEAARQIGIHPQSLRRITRKPKRGIVPIPHQVWRGKILFKRATVEMLKANYNGRPGHKPSPLLI
ncbi:MAG: hypothetical protein WD850_00340 [Candidatus Spechtbacterales bacterium]